MTSSAVRLMQRLLLGCASSSLLIFFGAPATAQQTSATPLALEADGDEAVKRLEEGMAQQAARLDAQAHELERQRTELAEQRQALKEQLEELARLKGLAAPAATSAIISPPAEVVVSGLSQDAFSSLRAGQTPPNASTTSTTTNIQTPPIPPASPPPDTGAPDRPVGAPPPARPASQLEALPDNIGVLTPGGRLVVESSLEYANFSTNRLVFRGVEIIPGVQIGLIEASDVNRNSLIGTLALRLGVTNRLELEMRAPYVYRNDEILTLAQRDEAITRSTQLEGHDMGDVEVSGRYQINSGRNGAPIWIANLRYKSNTGKGPFEVGRDENGIATELATGSGFWGIEPGLTFLMPSDPAVLFADVSYLYHAPDDINRRINGVLVGRVDPGDSINASLGFGFAVNQRFSFSLGYHHTYVFQTETELGTTRQSSDDLQVGSAQMGFSYRLNDRTSLNANFELGVTEDAPDVRIVFRVPFGG